MFSDGLQVCPAPARRVNYHWNHGNLEQGMAVGHAGTLQSIHGFQEKQEAIGAFSHVQSIL